MIYDTGISHSKFATKAKSVEYVVTPTGCWECVNRSFDKDGYPKLIHKGKTYRLCRFVYEKEKGTIPEGHVVRHSCDNPKCINPSHLSTGTVTDNAMDRNSRNRQAKGARNGSAKLTDEDAVKILHDPRSYSILAAEFNVSKRCVALIKKRKTWQHLGG